MNMTTITTNGHKRYIMPSPTATDGLAVAVHAAINHHLNGGACPVGGVSRGECAAVYQHWQHPETGERFFYAHVYIWPTDRNPTATEVAKWARDAGARHILISHELHDPGNGTIDGVCEDGALAWLVEFTDGASKTDESKACRAER